MSFGSSGSKVICIVLLSGIVLSGCVGDQTQDEVTGTSPDISGTEVEDRVLEAEQTYVEQQLNNASCLAEWGTEPVVGSRNVTIENHASEGVYANVRFPYWYSTGDTTHDSISNSKYLVSNNSVDRLDGPQIEPC